MSLLDFDREPDAYGVMGNPIAHSKSPAIHARFAEQTGQRIRYDAILVEPGGFRQAVGNFQASGGKGLNVTVPFKQEAWRLVDERSARADLAGAVNTIVFRPDGSMFGDNTDGIGIIRDIRDNHGQTITGKRVLVLGAGGAVRGILGPLLEEQPGCLVIANRTSPRATELAEAFDHLRMVHPTQLSGCGFDALQGQAFDLVINGTSASLQGEALPIPADVVAGGAWCYDMMYGAQPTPFMKWAMDHGASEAVDGLGMLVEQAAESFQIWRGVRPETSAVIAALRESMATH